ncbi:hypothetical protein AZE42_13303 [Rhizopogon vesiculosus]|uniref:Uncharacterized protein n=1 Tax=Rhizopogon vesiculosus TaxID=180088 RepID=A0A1J8R8B3_9AGAM|nr:hypothetical protein AZE42_13303 [Rhizopogon vesiculosus]
MALDSHFAQHCNMAVLNLITIFCAADFSAPYSADLCKQLSGDALEAALCIHYQSWKIKNLVLQTFDEFNLAEQFQQIIAVVMNPPSPTLCFPSLPPIATFSQADTSPESRHIDWATWFSDREPTPLAPDEEDWPEIDQGPFPPEPFIPTTPSSSSTDSGIQPEVQGLHITQLPTLIPIHIYQLPMPPPSAPSPPPLLVPSPAPPVIIAKNEEVMGFSPTVDQTPTPFPAPPSPTMRCNRHTKNRQ